MKTIYFECNMGAAGDMLLGALLELHPERESFLERLNDAGLPGIRVQAKKAVKCGIVGTRVSVIFQGAEEESLDVSASKSQEKGAHTHSHTHNHTHTHVHASLEHIFHIIDGLKIPEEAKKDVREIYTLLAQAEGAVHGVPMSEIHFHEVGTADALADITGCVLLLHELGAEKIVASPVTTGYGQVRCAHGILPVPAPAAARLLCGIPCQAGRIEGELCTPTGAALLKYFVSEFSRMPEMVIEKIGYGMGKKDFEAANCVRAILGEQEAGTEKERKV